jgi:predicted hydrolase (HD superfamily)
MDLEVKSVKKKWNIKGFAAGANREVIEKGAVMMGSELDYIIGETIAGMKRMEESI